MNTKDLQVAQTKYSRGEPRAWEVEINLDTSGNSDWVIIPEQISTISVTVSFEGGATGKIQTTTDLVYIIRTQIPTPIDWPFGEVNNNRIEVCDAISGLRAVQRKDGKMKITLRAQ